MKNIRKINPFLAPSSLNNTQQIQMQAAKENRQGVTPSSTLCKRCISPINMREQYHSQEQRQRKNSKRQCQEQKDGKKNLAISIDYEDRRQQCLNQSREDEVIQVKSQKKNIQEVIRSSCPSGLHAQTTKSRLGCTLPTTGDYLKKVTPTNGIHQKKIVNYLNQDYRQQRCEMNKGTSSPYKIVQLDEIDNIVEQKVQQREKRLIEKENVILQLQEDFQRKVEEFDNKIYAQNINIQNQVLNDTQHSHNQFGHSIPLTNIHMQQNLATSSSMDPRIDPHLGQSSNDNNNSQNMQMNRGFVRNSSEATTTYTNHLNNNTSTSLYSQNGLSTDQLIQHSKPNIHQRQSSLHQKGRDSNANNDESSQFMNIQYQRNRGKSLFTEDFHQQIKQTNNNNNNSQNNFEYPTHNIGDEDDEDYFNNESDDYHQNEQNYNHNNQKQQIDYNNNNNQGVNQNYSQYNNQKMNGNRDFNQLQTKFQSKVNTGYERTSSQDLILDNLSYSTSNKNSNNTKGRSTSYCQSNGQAVTPNSMGQFTNKNIMNSNNSYFQNSAVGLLNNTLSLNTTFLNQTQNPNNQLMQTQTSNNNNNQAFFNDTINAQFLDQRLIEKQKQLDFIDHETRLKEKAIKEKKETLSELERSVAEKKQFIMKYTDNYERLRENAHQVKIDMNEEEKILERIKEDRKKEQEQTKSLKAEQIELNERVSILKAELEVTQKNLNEKEVVLKERNDQLSLVQLQLQQTEASVQTSMIMIRQQTEQIEVRFKQLNELSIHVDKERRRIQSKEADAQNLHSTAVAIRESNLTKEKQLQKREEDVYRMQVHLDIERAAIDELKSKLKQQEAILAADKSKVDEVASTLSKEKQSVIQFKEHWEMKLKEKEENMFQREGSIKMKEDILLQQSQLYEDIELKMQGLQLHGQLWEKKCQVEQQNIMHLQQKANASNLYNSASAPRRRKITGSASGDFSQNKENELNMINKTSMFPPSSLKLIPPAQCDSNQSSQKPPFSFSNTKGDNSKLTVAHINDLQNSC